MDSFFSSKNYYFGIIVILEENGNVNIRGCKLINAVTYTHIHKYNINKTKLSLELSKKIKKYFFFKYNINMTSKIYIFCIVFIGEMKSKKEEKERFK
jgi:hypothetical protein